MPQGYHQDDTAAKSAGAGWVEAIAEMVAEEVEGHHGQENEDAGNQDPRVAREVLHVLRLREQVSPACGRFLDSEPEQRERALAEDEARNRQRGSHDRV